MLRAIAAVACVLLAAPAHAEGEPVSAGAHREVRAGSGAFYVQDAHLNAVSELRGFPRADMSVGYKPDAVDGRLTLELGYFGTQQSNTDYSKFETSIQLNTFSAGAKYGFFNRRWLSVYGRGALSFSASSLQIRDPAATDMIGQWAYTFGAQAAAGAEFLMTLHSGGEDQASRTQFGLYVEGGYHQDFNQARFNSVKPNASGDDKPTRIAFAPVNAGSLGLSGPFWRLGVLLRF